MPTTGRYCGLPGGTGTFRVTTGIFSPFDFVSPTTSTTQHLALALYWRLTQQILHLINLSLQPIASARSYQQLQLHLLPTQVFGNCSNPPAPSVLTDRFINSWRLALPIVPSDAASMQQLFKTLEKNNGRKFSHMVPLTFGKLELSASVQPVCNLWRIEDIDELLMGCSSTLLSQYAVRARCGSIRSAFVVLDCETGGSWDDLESARSMTAIQLAGHKHFLACYTDCVVPTWLHQLLLDTSLDVHANYVAIARNSKPLSYSYSPTCDSGSSSTAVPSTDFLAAPYYVERVDFTSALPYELLQHILLYCDNSSLLSCSAVCVALQRAALRLIGQRQAEYVQPYETFDINYWPSMPMTFNGKRLPCVVWVCLHYYPCSA
jgi:hypothetical protein